eukprot:gene6125-8443_t
MSSNKLPLLSLDQHLLQLLPNNNHGDTTEVEFSDLKMGMKITKSKLKSQSSRNDQSGNLVIPMVTFLQGDGVAYKQGIRHGDVVIKINDQSFYDYFEFSQLFLEITGEQYLKPFTLKVLHGIKSHLEYHNNKNAVNSSSLNAGLSQKTHKIMTFTFAQQSIGMKIVKGHMNESSERVSLNANTKPVVFRVIENSPAQKAGVLHGDTIVALNGKKITSHEDFNKTFPSIGRPVSISFLRGIHTEEVDKNSVISIASGSSKKMTGPMLEQSAPVLDHITRPGGYHPLEDVESRIMFSTEVVFHEKSLGMKVVKGHTSDNSDNNAVESMTIPMVSKVMEGGEAYLGGVHEGDIIICLNGDEIKSFESFSSIFPTVPRPVTMRFYRGFHVSVRTKFSNQSEMVNDLNSYATVKSEGNTWEQVSSSVSEREPWAVKTATSKTIENESLSDVSNNSKIKPPPKVGFKNKVSPEPQVFDIESSNENKRNDEKPPLHTRPNNIPPVTLKESSGPAPPHHKIDLDKIHLHSFTRINPCGYINEQRHPLVRINNNYNQIELRSPNSTEEDPKYDSWIVHHNLDKVVSIDDSSIQPSSVSSNREEIQFCSQNRLWQKLKLLFDNFVQKGFRKLSIVTIGSAGSGKSYTLFGKSTCEERGIMPRFFDYQFNSQDNSKPASYIIITMCLIQQETLIDLFDPPKVYSHNGNMCSTESLGPAVIPLKTFTANSAALCLNAVGLGLKVLGNIVSSQVNILSQSHVMCTCTILHDLDKTMRVVEFIELAGSLFTNINAERAELDAFTGQSSANWSLKKLVDLLSKPSKLILNSKDHNDNMSPLNSSGLSCIHHSVLCYLLQEIILRQSRSFFINCVRCHPSFHDENVFWLDLLNKLSEFHAQQLIAEEKSKEKMKLKPHQSAAGSVNSASLS